MPRCHALIAAIAVLFPLHCSALTLNEALVLTYQKHPELLAQREQVKVTDENASQAFAGWLPSSSISLERGKQKIDRGSYGNSDTIIDAKSIDITQPIYKGGRTTATEEKAQHQIAQARYNLTSTEQRLLLEAVEAYMAVVRSQERLTLYKHNETLFTKELELAKSRFELGELSKVDVAQAEVKLAEAVSLRIEAEKNLQKSYVEFEETIGEHPTSVALPENSPSLIMDKNELVTIALKTHPSIAAKQSEIDAANNDIDIEKSYILPSVDLVAGRDESKVSFFTGDSTDIETDSIRFRVSIPLFNTSSRGAEHSRIRQAKRYHEQLRYELTDTQQLVEREALTAYRSLEQIREVRDSLKTRIRAAETVLKGISEEERAGAKTLLDVLEAQQELLTAKDALINNEVDEIIYSYTLLARIGRLTIEDLELAAEYYNPYHYHDQVQHQLIGF